MRRDHELKVGGVEGGSVAEEGGGRGGDRPGPEGRSGALMDRKIIGMGGGGSAAAQVAAWAALTLE